MGLVLAARLIVALVLVVAGVAKLFDREGSEESFLGFGVPHFLVATLAWLLPIAELTVGLGQLPARTSVWAAEGALGLFSIFAIAVAFNLQQGNEVDCHCFGNLHSEKISWATLARNFALIGAAAFILFERQTSSTLSLVAWLRLLTVGERVILAMGLAILVGLGFAISLMRSLKARHEELAREVQKISKEAKPKTTPALPNSSRGVYSPARGLPIGAPAPAFSLQSLDEDELSLADLLKDERPALLTFVDPNCPPCEALIPSIEKWDREHGDRLNFALITSGDGDHVYAFASTGIQRVLGNGAAVHKAYAASWTPSAVLVNPQGTVGSRLANGAEAVEALVRHTIHNGSKPWLGMPKPSKAPEPEDPAPVIKIGDTAPQFSLRSLEGGLVRLSDFLGRKVALLFWSAGCSFCQEMASDIKEFEETFSETAPQLLFISRGNARANRRFGFHSPILIAGSSGIADQFGFVATPSAVIIDEKGRIASFIEDDAASILALFGARSKSDLRV